MPSGGFWAQFRLLCLQGETFYHCAIHHLLRIQLISALGSLPIMSPHVYSLTQTYWQALLTLKRCYVSLRLYIIFSQWGCCPVETLQLYEIRIVSKLFLGSSPIIFYNGKLQVIITCFYDSFVVVFFVVFFGKLLTIKHFGAFCYRKWIDCLLIIVNKMYMYIWGKNQQYYVQIRCTVYNISVYFCKCNKDSI